jgi:hypothetical protein
MGIVCELKVVTSALVKEGLPPSKEAIKEKVLAWANTGKTSMTKVAQPPKRLKNKGFMSFFVKKRLTNEEMNVL